MDKITFNSIYSTLAHVLVGGFFVLSLYGLTEGNHLMAFCYLTASAINAVIGYKSSIDLVMEHRKQAIEDYTKGNREII